MQIVLCFCFVFLRLVYPMLPVSLNCPFLIALQYFLTFWFFFIGNCIRTEITVMYLKICHDGRKYSFSGSNKFSQVNSICNHQISSSNQFIKFSSSNQFIKFSSSNQFIKSVHQIQFIKLVHQIQFY